MPAYARDAAMSLAPGAWIPTHVVFPPQGDRKN
jgi:hypothetical protein